MENLALKQNPCIHKYRASPWEPVTSHDGANSPEVKCNYLVAAKITAVPVLFQARKDGNCGLRYGSYELTAAISGSHGLEYEESFLPR